MDEEEEGLNFEDTIFENILLRRVSFSDTIVSPTKKIHRSSSYTGNSTIRTCQREGEGGRGGLKLAGEAKRKRKRREREQGGAG